MVLRCSGWDVCVHHCRLNVVANTLTTVIMTHKIKVEV